MAMTARTLVLLRHAKAQTPGELPDIERPLTERGRADAGAAGTWLADEGLRPGLVICSPAVRTRQTWHAVAIALATCDPSGGAPEVHYEQQLYDGGRTELVDLVQAVSDDITTVLVIGHNPTVSDVSLLLRPDHTDRAGRRAAHLRPGGARDGWVLVDLRAGHGTAAQARTPARSRAGATDAAARLRQSTRRRPASMRSPAVIVMGHAAVQKASSDRSIRSRLVFSMIRRSAPMRGRTSRAKNRAAAILPS